MRCLAAALALVAPLLLGACATVEPGSYKTGPRDLVLQLVDIPGVLRPGEPTSVMPTFSLYGDGRVIVSTRGEHEGALPKVRQLQLSRERVEQLVSAALDADVQDRQQVDIEIAPDASTSVLTLRAEGRSGWSELGPEADGRLGDLRDALRQYAERPTTVPYQHDAIAVIATPGGGTSSKTWPLPELRPSAELRVEGSLCTVYRRVGVTDTTNTARAASPDTIWSSGNQSYRVHFRPMLPHETDCSSLVREQKKPDES